MKTNFWIDSFSNYMHTAVKLYQTKQYLVDIKNESELCSYEEFEINDDLICVCIGWENEIMRLQLEEQKLDGVSSIIITSNLIEFYPDENEDETLFSVPHPYEINNEETFFQISTTCDLSCITNGHEWFMDIMNCYKQINEIWEKQLGVIK